ncbi:trypsin-like peptidase domain-containing protein [Brevundimonas sp.]|uniref:trypsin-like peptidase domain-containing protein n=1 Tax=Brevundimonas sp. TaxID=1871086 RepID=UPI00261ED366|nr:trypsin-like peptidase domain-containing protein [Brevundimonas sp.]
MMKRKEFMLGAIAGLTFAAAATAGGVIDWPSANAGPVAGFTGRLAPTAGAAGLAFAPPQGAPLSFADIFAQVAPAVVQIDVKTRVPRSSMIQIPGTPFAIPNPNGGEEGEEGTDDEGTTAMGAGSGFFIAANGFIVTNNHVVADATEIMVKLADGRELEARVIGRDEATDLAVIKVEGTDFPFVTFEETAQPRVGDWVIAVGNPFGLGGTATAGIVSAQSRQNLADPTSSFVDFLQIDAAINRGNSGGPTFDIYGRVIGVNSAIISPTGGSVGIGFAIPASVAKPVTDQLMRGVTVQRGFVGLGLRTFDADRWEALGQARDFKGAYVESVTPDAPAEQAGVQEGDLLVGVNGRPVANGTEATRAVGSARPGETIRLEVIRDGRRRTINVRSGVRPSETELLADQDQGGGEGPRNSPTAPQGQVLEGATVRSITPAQRSQYGIPETVTGVIVTSVARGTPAAEAGLQAGIVISRAGNRTIGSAADLAAAIREIKAAGRPSILLFVSAGGQRGTLVLKFETE